MRNSILIRSDRYSAPAFEDEAENMTVNQAVPSRITEKGAEKEHSRLFLFI